MFFMEERRRRNREGFIRRDLRGDNMSRCDVCREREAGKR